LADDTGRLSASCQFRLYLPLHGLCTPGTLIRSNLIGGSPFHHVTRSHITGNTGVHQHVVMAERWRAVGRDLWMLRQ